MKIPVNQKHFYFVELSNFVFFLIFVPISAKIRNIKLKMLRNLYVWGYACVKKRYVWVSGAEKTQFSLLLNY